MLNKILENLKNFPNAECYEIEDKVYKNRDLYKYVCNICQYLLESNKLKKPVIVYGHKEIYMIAGFLACSFCGMTYVPIDKSIPEERKNKIINQINPDVIIDENIEKIMTNDNYKEIDKIFMQDDDTYYIIFTSGSTGEPKGVCITYRNIKSCVKWLESICNIKNGTILNQANYSFDLSVADIYLSLLTNSKHFILNNVTQKDYPKLFKEIEKSNCNLAVMTPSFADLLLLDPSFNENMLPNLTQILFCGESLKENTVSKLKNRFKNLKITNCYGPTECTFAVTSIDIENGEKISLGNPKNDVKIYIVDNELNELNEGEIGEILISGESVGKGYLKEELNRNIFIEYKSEKAYLTGDLAYKENGKIYYLGRNDSQIKYRGYRIELSEIENVLNKLDFIERAVVATSKNESGKINKIIAFVKLKDDRKIEISEITEYMKKILPDYMIPIVKIINNFPLNTNGKTDIKKLLEML